MWVWGPRIPQSPGPFFTCSPLCSEGKPPLWTLGVLGPLYLTPTSGLVSAACPSSPVLPSTLPRRAQGLVSLRATGREVFDWILDQGYYSERDTSNVVRQVLEAVAYLHSLKIVHRNLKVRSRVVAQRWQPGWDLAGQHCKLWV